MSVQRFKEELKIGKIQFKSEKKTYDQKYTDYNAGEHKQIIS